MMKIMFICTGNTCRSAMAEAILKKKAEEKKLNIEVYSAGLYADNRDGATLTATEIMEKMGIDLKNHRATNIRYSKITEMDIILCATKGHKIQTINLYPELKEKIFTIKEYANGEEGDIEDPWGNNARAYEICAKELEECIDKIIEKL